ncbi:MAG: hypothetical protein LQ344_004632 [Seirophora lacunosa]|nr:MAG: hypothetical protein LQ344_004632 [Seirophora lacunosa]
MATHNQLIVHDRAVYPDLPETTLHEEKEYDPQSGEIEVDPVSRKAHLPAPYVQDDLIPAEVASGKRRLWKKKRFWLSLIALLLLAGIIGGLAGDLTNRHSDESRSSGSTAETADSASSTPSATPSPFNSSLASVAWLDPAGVGYRRLYYQDSVGTIKETAWNSSAGAWYASNNALGTARPNSPLAAAVLLNLYYLDTNGRLVELSTADAKSWTRGPISTIGITPAADSDIAATWTRYDGVACNNCVGYGHVVGYEDSNAALQVVNATQSGFQYRELKADPVPGSGLAMNLAWHGDRTPGIRLFYQKGSNTFHSIDWEESDKPAGDGGNTAGDWTLHEDTGTGRAASGAPMASFSWGFDATSGNPLLMVILSSGPQGVEVTWWTPSGWQDPQQPEALKNIQAYSALAANGNRYVYALQGDSVREFTVTTDGLTWTLVGDVPTEF